MQQPRSNRDNGITALRLLLAVFILFVHAWPIGGFGRDPVDVVTGGGLGGGGVLGVAAFFGLSGYLLVFSRRQQGSARFLARRASRIVPAYIVVVAATAAVVGCWYLAAAWFPSPGVGGISWAGWETHPLALVNASLWTLWPELCCYVLITITPPRALPLVLPLAGAMVVAAAVLAPGATLAATIVVGPTAAFIAGAMIAVWHDRIPMSLPIGIAAVVMALWTLSVPAGSTLLGAAVAYLSIVVGLRLTLRWRTDLSYGTYLVAFPITQALVAVGLDAWGPLPLALMALSITLPVAALSWRFIERPALALGSWSPRRVLTPTSAPAPAPMPATAAAPSGVVGDPLPH